MSFIIQKSFSTNFKLDQVVHVWTDDVRPRSKPSFGNSSPSTSSPLTLTLSEGKVGHKVVPGNDQEQATMFRTALGANSGGIVGAVYIKNIVNAVKNPEHQRGNVVVCVKKVNHCLYMCC